MAVPTTATDAYPSTSGATHRRRACPLGVVASGRSGSVPAAVKRDVWTRDGGRCQWAMASGGVCGSKTRLELDHIVPLARGGSSTPGNIRILCAFHNQLAARQAFGAAWMDRFTSKSIRTGHDAC